MEVILIFCLSEEVREDLEDGVDGVETGGGCEKLFEWEGRGITRGGLRRASSVGERVSWYRWLQIRLIRLIYHINRG